ncbi:MAG: glycoside hydrolase family protein [Planctomycetes bacterium]|nr:glycoside hydrolase family protein [Planctomycetota bacterium]
MPGMGAGGALQLDTMRHLMLATGQLCLLITVGHAQALTPAADDLDLHGMLGTLAGAVSGGGKGVTIDGPAVLRAEDRHVWGGSVIRGEDGRYHMFVSRFRAGPESRGFADEWLLSSEIAHAVSDHPDHGYEFTGVVLRGRLHDGDPKAWDARTVHNPHVRRFGDRVYLYYIGSYDPGPQPEGSPGASLNDRNRIQQVQQVGVVSAATVADLAAGRFDRPDRPLLGPRTRVKAKDVIAPSPPGTVPLPDNMIVVNPSVVRRPADGSYLLYFKGNLYDPRWRGVHGVAIGDAPDGPFTALDRFVFDVRMDDGRLASAEDPFVWHDAGRHRFYAIVKDFSGRMTGGTPALALLTSIDGLEWHPAAHPLVTEKQLRLADDTVLAVRNLERPQLLFDADGRPRTMFCACIVGPDNTGPAINVQIPLQPR